MLYHVSTISIIKEDRLKKKKNKLQKSDFLFFFPSIVSHLIFSSFHTVSSSSWRLPHPLTLLFSWLEVRLRIEFPSLFPLRLQALLSWLEWSAGQFDNWICGSGVIYVHEGPELTIGREGGHAMHPRQTSWRRSAWRES